jgi:NDP-sugar pyrophosphorylase family protein
MYPVAVLAGGLGTRIAAVAGPDAPKVLLPVAGRPFLDFKLASLAAQGIERAVLLLGHGADHVADHLRSTGTFGIDVEVLRDGPQLMGTGGAIRRALGSLGDRFWVTYGDSYLRAPMAQAERAFEPASADALMTVLRNRDAWDRSNIAVTEGMVAAYEKGAPAGRFEYIDYGLLLLVAGAFTSMPDEPFGLEDVLRPLVARRRVAAFEVTERFYEIGTPAGYAECDAFLAGSAEWDRLRTAEA